MDAAENHYQLAPRNHTRAPGALDPTSFSPAQVSQKIDRSISLLSSHTLIGWGELDYYY